MIKPSEGQTSSATPFTASDSREECLTINNRRVDMSKRLSKRDPTPPSVFDALDLSRKELISEITKDFISWDSTFYNESFDKLNEQFFNNSLPSVLIFAAEFETIGGYFASYSEHSQKGYIFLRSSYNFYDRDLTLLHEMIHLKQHLCNEKCGDHDSEAWILDCQRVFDKLNVPLKADELSEAELKGFPFRTFDRFGLMCNIYQNGQLTPLPDNFELVEIPKETPTPILSATLHGSLDSDIEILRATFGTDYLQLLKEIL